MSDTTTYESARQFAKRKILSERQLRQLISVGKVPGIQTAKGFKINCTLFMEQLENLCKSNVTGGTTI